MYLRNLEKFSVSTEWQMGGECCQVWLGGRRGCRVIRAWWTTAGTRTTLKSHQQGTDLILFVFWKCHVENRAERGKTRGWDTTRPNHKLSFRKAGALQWGTEHWELGGWCLGQKRQYEGASVQGVPEVVSSSQGSKAGIGRTVECEACHGRLQLSS